MKVARKTHDQIVVDLPYPCKFKIFGNRFYRKRRIGFMFVNLTVLLFREANGLRDSEDLKKWIDNNSYSELAFQSIYYAAVAYNMFYRKPDNFDMEGFRLAVNNADQSVLENILAVSKSSETFGVTIKKKQEKGKSK